MLAISECPCAVTVIAAPDDGVMSIRLAGAVDRFIVTATGVDEFVAVDNVELARLA